MVSRIHSLTLDTASPASRDVMQHVKGAVGKVPNLYATMAHSPAALRGLLAFEQDLDKTGRLSKRDVELIALRMAQLNGCGYCLSAHYLFSEKVGLTMLSWYRSNRLPNFRICRPCVRVRFCAKL